MQSDIGQMQSDIGSLQTKVTEHESRLDLLGSIDGMMKAGHLAEWFKLKDPSENVAAAISSRWSTRLSRAISGAGPIFVVSTKPFFVKPPQVAD